MDLLCRLLICSWLISYFWKEYRRKKRDQVNAPERMAVATSEPRSCGRNQLAPFASPKEDTCTSSW
jgi:hypothetical protein